MTRPAGAARVTPVILATRVRKARYPRACARCGVFVEVGQRVGLVPGLGWCHLVPCIVRPPGQRRPA